MNEHLFDFNRLSKAHGEYIDGTNNREYNAHIIMSKVPSVNHEHIHNYHDMSITLPVDMQWTA